MNFAATDSMLQSAETLIPGFRQNIPAAVVYSNAAAIGLKQFANRMLHQVYPPHIGSFEPVRLGAFPPGTRLLGGHAHWLEADGTLAREQINPLTTDVVENYAGLTAMPFATETVTEDTILVARYGDVTWGHWVAEILPRAIMAEHAYPGRFRFAVSDQIIGDHGYGSRILESLAAYGISPERILRLRFDAHYRFERLHSVSNIWSTGGMNPQIIQIMQDDIAAPPPSLATGKLAVLRRDSKTRNIANIDDIIALMHRENFTVVDMAAQPFLNQVAFFRDCHTVFGVLGSGLIGLIYSPAGVNVASVAPGDWDDTYFHGLIRHRQGSHADIRCPIIWDGEGIERDAPMVAFPAHIEAGLAALATPEALRAPDGILTIGGAKLRRDIGTTLLHLEFSPSGIANMFLGEGWGDQEPNHIWSIGPRSALAIPRPFETENIELQLEVISLVDPDYLIARKLEIFAGGINLGTFAVAGYALISCAVPPACFTNDLTLDIAFAHPYCISAATTGHAADDRPLGLGFVALRIVSHAKAAAPASEKSILTMAEPVLI